MLLITLVKQSQAGNWEFSGYTKTFVIFQHSQFSYNDNWILTGPWALKLSYVPQNYLSFNLAYLISPHWNSPAVVFDGASTTSPSPYRFHDFDQRLWPKAADELKKLSLWHNLDRAYVRLSTGWADIFAGRQPIAWGSARFINPTDIVAPYGFQELDNEDRVGVDAAKINIPLGQMSEIGLGYIAGKDLEMENNALYIRPKLYLLKTDLALVFMKFKRNRLWGFDMARSIGGAGVWLEAGYMRFKRTDETGMRLSAGADYRLSGKIYAFGEYHFNGFGEVNASEYFTNHSKQAYLENIVYLMAENYLTLGMNYQLTPLLTSTTQPILNLNDLSLIINEQLEYNLTQNSYLACGLFKGYGKKAGASSSGLLQTRSEFGSYSDIYYFSYRKYF